MTGFMDLSFRPLCAVIIPLTVSALICIFGRHIRPHANEVIAFILSALEALVIFPMVRAVLAETEIRLELFSIADGMSVVFSVDPAGMVCVCAACMLWILISIYSMGYMSIRGKGNPAGYYGALALCMSAGTGMCFAGNLITFFIFYEIFMLAVCPLAAQGSDGEKGGSDLKYIACIVTSGLVFLAAIVKIYSSAGTLDFVPGGFLTSEMLTIPWALALLLMMSGAVIANTVVISVLCCHQTAPGSLSVFLHTAAMVNAGALCILRIMLYVYGPAAAAECHGSIILAWTAVLTIIISSLIAISRRSLHAVLVFSTIGQLAYAALGICILTPFSTAGALFHITAHSLAKSSLIMVAAAVCVVTNKKDIREMTGTGRQMPAAMMTFTAASAGMAGFPLFAGFVSKANMILGAVAAGKPAFVLTLAAGDILALSYLLPVVLIAFRKNPNETEFKNGKTASNLMLLPAIISVILLIILGIAPDFGLNLFSLALMSGNSVFNPLM